MNGKWISRIVVLLFFSGLVFAFYSLHLEKLFTLEFLKQNHQNFLTLYQQSPSLVIGLFFALYVLVASASLPGSALLILAAGALFGRLTGTIVVSFASTIGATIAFLVSRFLFRDYVKVRFSQVLTKINHGIEKDGAFYLFTLRLNPLFPFFIINLVMGLTQINVVTFFVVSQIGMLIGTFVFVNAGCELGQIDSVKDVLSFSVISSLVAISLLPLMAKIGLALLEKRRKFAKFPRPKKFDYNLIAIGGGSAGLVASFVARSVRAKVALIEKNKMGGDCLYTGCIPSKALIKSARILAETKKAELYGFDKIDIDFSFAKVMKRIHRVVQKVSPHDSAERYESLGVECIKGEAKILTPFTVQVGDRILTTKNIVIATGARPVVPAIEGLDQITYYTSDNLWSLEKLPKRLVVLGGGAIGSELAQCFARLGSQVTQIERSARILPREDIETSKLMTEVFVKEGIDIKTHAQSKRIEVEGKKKFLIYDHKGKEESIEFDEILLALGRKASVSGFGLEDIGIPLNDRGSVETDEYMRTCYPNIYVCGDVAGPFQFTHTASLQAWYAATNALFAPFKKCKVDYRVLPWATFTDPEVAKVGINEQEAKEKDIPYELTVYSLEQLHRAICDEEDTGYIRIITQKGTDKILGVTIVSTRASDMIIEFATAMKYGIGLRKILSTVHLYPSYGEANKYAAGLWKRQHTSETLLQWLERFHAWRRGAR